MSQNYFIVHYSTQFRLLMFYFPVTDHLIFRNKACKPCMNSSISPTARSAWSISTCGCLCFCMCQSNSASNWRNVTVFNLCNVLLSCCRHLLRFFNAFWIRPLTSKVFWHFHLIQKSGMLLDRDEYSVTNFRNMDALSSNSRNGVSNSATRPVNKMSKFNFMSTK